MVLVRNDFEDHEVTKVLATGRLQLCKHLVRRAIHPEIDVFRGACAFKTQLENEPTFQSRGVSEYCDDARKKTLEGEELALTRELAACRRGRAKALLKCLLEALG